MYNNIITFINFFIFSLYFYLVGRQDNENKNINGLIGTIVFLIFIFVLKHLIMVVK